MARTTEMRLPTTNDTILEGDTESACDQVQLDTLDQTASEIRLDDTSETVEQGELMSRLITRSLELSAPPVPPNPDLEQSSPTDVAAFGSTHTVSSQSDSLDDWARVRYCRACGELVSGSTSVRPARRCFAL